MKRQLEGFLMKQLSDKMCKHREHQALCAKLGKYDDLSICLYNLLRFHLNKELQQ